MFAGRLVKVALATSWFPRTEERPFGLAASHCILDPEIPSTENETRSLMCCKISVLPGLAVASKLIVSTPGVAELKVYSFCPRPESTGAVRGSPWGVTRCRSDVSQTRVTTHFP